MRLLTFLLPIAALLGCVQRPEATQSSNALPFPPRPLAEIAEAQEIPDFQDLVLSVTSADRRADTVTIAVAGTHDGRKVGFRIALSPGDQGVYRVRVESSGPQSDAFVASLGELYKSAAPSRMAAFAVFDAMSLDGGIDDLARREVKLKLFCNSESEDRYCELYLNPNLPAGTVEIAEKDPGYRAAVLAWLGQRNSDAQPVVAADTPKAARH